MIITAFLLLATNAMAVQIDGRFIQDGSITSSKITSGVITFGSFPLTPSSNPVNPYDVANKQYVDSHSSHTPLHELLPLHSTDITNQYKDSSQQCVSGSEMVNVVGLKGSIGQDYTLSIVSSKTRITFAATVVGPVTLGYGTGSQQALTAFDTIDFQCEY